LGRVLDEAQKQIRDGEVDPELLKKLGMTETQFNQFVKRYADAIGNIRHQLGLVTVKRVPDRIRIPGSDKLDSGRGTDRRITDTTGHDDLTPDQIRELHESRSKKVSPEYRKQVEEYYRNIAELYRRKKNSDQ